MAYFGLRGSALSRAIITLVVCPAFVAYGYNLSVAGGLLTLDSFVKAFPELDTINTHGSKKSYNSTIQGTVVALFTVGGIFGSLSCIYLGDLLGRKKVIFVASGITAVGAILMATSYSLAQFIVARLVLGLGTGGYLATVPVWQSEISKATKRGAHVITDGIFIGAGAALALWIDFGFYFVKDSSVSWRFPLAFQVVMFLCVMLFIVIFPESPRWLIKKGKLKEARDILAALADADPESEAISADIRDIELSLSICGNQSWKSMLTMGEQRLLNRTLLAAGAQIMQQMCGINLTTMYATSIFEQNLGLDSVKARILAACMCFMQVFGGLLAFYTIDRLGRRPLMLWSAGGLTICMSVLAGSTSTMKNGATIVAAIFLFAFQFIFTVGYSGLTYLYAAEIAPLQLRAAISAVSTAAVWLFNFLLAEVTPIGFDTIGYKYYIVFAVLNAAIVPTVYFFYPETNGRSLEEIDDIFAQSKTIFDPPRIARQLPTTITSDAERTVSEDKA